MERQRREREAFGDHEQKFSYFCLATKFDMSCRKALTPAPGLLKSYKFFFQCVSEFLKLRILCVSTGVKCGFFFLSRYLPAILLATEYRIKMSTFTSEIFKERLCFRLAPSPIEKYRVALFWSEWLAERRRGSVFSIYHKIRSRFVYGFIELDDVKPPKRARTE